ncbi:MAG: hypothetical protein ISS63_13750 [Desulfobacteraceae bacterium]|nr:hypothetical protein [Desulfobacteraceae bacterium]
MQETVCLFEGSSDRSLRVCGIYIASDSSNHSAAVGFLTNLGGRSCKQSFDDESSHGSGCHG